jgi:hypothetical protein
VTQTTPLRFQLSSALQQRYRSKREAFQLYRALAERESLKARQEILLMLARNAERSAATDAIRLLRLDGAIPDEPASLRHTLWQKVLVCGGYRVATLWLERLEKRADRRCINIFQAYLAATNVLYKRVVNSRLLRHFGN